MPSGFKIFYFKLTYPKQSFQIIKLAHYHLFNLEFAIIKVHKADRNSLSKRHNVYTNWLCKRISITLSSWYTWNVKWDFFSTWSNPGKGRAIVERDKATESNTSMFVSWLLFAVWAATSDLASLSFKILRKFETNTHFFVGKIIIIANTHWMLTLGQPPE